MRSYLPPPWIEGVGVVVDVGAEVDGAEVDEDAPALWDEISLHLHVPHRLPHDPADDVADPQRLRDHLNARIVMLFLFVSSEHRAREREMMMR